MIYTIILSRKWEFTGQAILSWLLGGSSIIALLLADYRYYSLPIGFAGYMLAPTHKGILISLVENRYKLYRSWAGMRLGAWQHLPRVQHVIVKYFSYQQHVRNRTGRNQQRQVQEYILMLSVANASPGIIINRYAELEEAHLTAASIAAVLGVDAQLFMPTGKADNSLTIS